MKLTQGNLISNRYRLVRRIGIGGFSEVWLVLDKLMEDHQLALKIYAPDRGLDDSGLRQFQREYLLMVPLHHPGLLKPSHYDVHEDSPYLVMPYCEKGSLAGLLSDRGILTEKEIAEVLFQLGGSLSYLHGEGLLHQDIKPDNILLSESDQYLLTDFGISSKMRSTLRKSTNTGKAMTVAYAPPERFKGTQTSSSAGDIFSVGVMIFELTTGDVPWMGAGGVVLRPDMELPELPGGYSKRLEQLMRWCIAYDPKDRPSPEELRALASHYLKTESWPEIPKPRNQKADQGEKVNPGRQTEYLKPEEPIPEKEEEKPTKEEILSQAVGIEKPKSKRWLAIAALVLVLSAAGIYWWTGPGQTTDTTSSPPVIGIVLDEGGEPLSGASVTVKGTTVGTATDGKGLFSIKAKQGDSLMVNFADRIPETIWIASEDTVRVRLKNALTKGNGQSTLASEPKQVSPTLPSATSVTTEQEDMAKSKAQEEEDAWDRAKRGNTKYDYEQYLSKYPQGKYRSDANRAVLALEPKQTSPTLPATIVQLEQNMVRVDGGTFMMGCTTGQGSDCYDHEKPAHQVTLSTFRIGKYEVTQAQWYSVMGNNPSMFSGCENCPVETVSWNEIKEFLKKLNQLTGKNYRLPTEAEWEYAGRGGNRSRGYKYSGGNTLGSVAWNKENSGNKTHPVGQKLPNELGIYDMSGNVWEFCSDWSGEDYYASSLSSNPRGPSSGSDRVLRGGSWSNSAVSCRVVYRGYLDPSNRFVNNGFRVVLSQ